MLSRLGYSKKGWTNGEIGAEWIKHFDEQTKGKANGKWRSLLVDGHNSHYTQAFLEYATVHRIHVLCYPAHATHVYQGLDVVIFGILKLYWTQAKEQWEREQRTTIDKTNFLEIHGAAHIKTLTPETIKMAFEKTGVFPFNLSVVTAEMMAPSLESSYRGRLPLAPSTPVKVITDLLHDMHERHHLETARREENKESDNEMDTNLPTVTGPAHALVQMAINALASTSASFLITSPPVQSTSQLPTFNTFPISPTMPPDTHRNLLNVVPTTDYERQLQSALREANEREAYHKGCIVGLQASGILNGAYVDVVHSQLKAQEEKKKKKKKGHLVGDGLPCLLTAAAFVDRVVQFEADKARKEADLVHRKSVREVRTIALVEWKRLDDERKDMNKVIRDLWQEAVDKWELERNTAKVEKRKIGWKKPVLKGALLPPVPRPAPPADEVEGTVAVVAGDID
jgi:hypothetical protein